MKESRTVCGDSLEVLKEVESESVDLLCTDPPYGYSFMGESWDKTLPDIGIFKECHRVLKAGAFAFVMSAPRSDVCARMMLMLEDAGFEIGFTPIYWTYASGFPKAMNIGKAVDKRAGVEREKLPNPRAKQQTASIGTNAYGDYNATTYITPTPATPEAKALDGSYGGFQPKPAVEVVIVAMKPLSEKTYVDQALKNGKGITWLDDCRVPTTATLAPEGGWNPDGYVYAGEHGERKSDEFYASGDEKGGRFPANLLVSDDVLNDGVRRHAAGNKTPPINASSFVGSNTRGMDYDQGGSYSRYFDLDAWAKTLPFLIVPKASKREKNEGLGEFPTKQVKGGGGTNGRVATAYGSVKAPQKNIHPTCKPVKLMSYLITLGSRPGDVVLDPFMGSGTTLVAAKQLNRNAVGIEISEKYCEIARQRLAQQTLL